jgi:16S rRNA (uracil1498-N3)-methyltransferase
MNKSISKSSTKRFYLRHSSIPETLQPGAVYYLNDTEEEILYQLTKVFRASPGQKIILINRHSDSSNNQEFHFQIKNLSKKSLEIELLELKTFSDPLSKELSLALCLPNKPAKLDFILEKTTELGVHHFHLIKSDLSQFSHQIRADRLEKIILEAAEQSERAVVPSLKLYNSFEEYLQSNPGHHLVALEHSQKSQSLLNQQIQTATTVVIGPEGGFSEREVRLIQGSNLPIINLGGSILKMDTAALLAVGIVALKLQQ